MKKAPLLCVLGPTASGKSGLAVKLALKYGGEIISADSMQIYKGFNIGTAKITTEEMNNVPHYMLDVVEPYGNYSVADFCKDATEVADGIIKRGKLPILAGGTGLYINSLTENIKFFDFIKDTEYSEFLDNLEKENGKQFLWDMLFENDPELAKKTSPNNIKKVKHALEVFRVTGKTYDVIAKESKQEAKYDVVKIGLRFSDRELLYDRINLRVDKMMKEGLLDEVRHLLSIGVPAYSQAMNGIGYKEILQYLNGECSLLEAVENIKMNSRRYAKRQMTWFRRDESIQWIDVDKTDDIFMHAVNIVETNCNFEV